MTRIFVSGKPVSHPDADKVVAAIKATEQLESVTSCSARFESPPRAKASIIAEWRVALYCNCPGCDTYVDLMAHPDFFYGTNIEIAEHDTERSNSLEVVCPECGHGFGVCCVW